MATSAFLRGPSLWVPPHTEAGVEPVGLDADQVRWRPWHHRVEVLRQGDPRAGLGRSRCDRDGVGAGAAGNLRLFINPHGQDALKQV